MINISNEFQTTADNFMRLKEQSDVVEKIIQACVSCLQNGHKIMFCGNGGSASQAQHLAAELVGRYKMNRPAMNAVSLTTDTSNITAIGNDYGFEEIFARQVDGIGQSGDILIGLSTSGNSKNVVRAFLTARERGISCIAITGEKDCEMHPLADIVLAVPSNISNQIQEMHLACGHLICGAIEQALYGEKSHND